MELCEGGELFHQIVKLTYFSEELSRHVITQVAAAVKYLHEECGIVHRFYFKKVGFKKTRLTHFSSRDIKPENILFDPIPILPSRHRKLRPTDNESKVDEGEFIKGYGGGGIGRIKLADFGLSKVIWDNSTLTPCGTVGYTAPEIVCDQQYSKSVDMWAIGCVLYTILCGFPPFYDESIQSLTDKVARGHFTFLSPWWDTMSQSVKDLIRHLLCVDSKKRFTIHELLEHPWITERSPLRPSSREQSRIRQGPVGEEEDVLMDEANYSTPDAATLREIFDVTYAVQRMGEEQPKKEETKPRSHPVPVPHTQQNHHLPIAQKLAKHSRGVANPVRCQYNPQYPQPVEQLPNTIAKQKFNLDMNNATLLKNRKGAMKAQV